MKQKRLAAWSFHLSRRTPRPPSARRSKQRPFCLDWRIFSQIGFALILSWLCVPCQPRTTRMHTQTHAPARQTSEVINGLFSDTFSICLCERRLAGGPDTALPGGGILNQPDAATKNITFSTLLFSAVTTVFRFYFFFFLYQSSSFALFCGTTIVGTPLFFHVCRPFNWLMRGPQWHGTDFLWVLIRLSI